MNESKKCTLCGKVSVYYEATELALNFTSITGEQFKGITVCPSCRAFLSNYALQIQNISHHAKMVGYQKGMDRAIDGFQKSDAYNSVLKLDKLKEERESDAFHSEYKYQKES